MDALRRLAQVCTMPVGDHREEKAIEVMDETTLEAFLRRYITQISTQRSLTDRFDDTPKGTRVTCKDPETKISISKVDRKDAERESGRFKRELAIEKQEFEKVLDKDTPSQSNRVNEDLKVELARLGRAYMALKLEFCVENAVLTKELEIWDKLARDAEKEYPVVQEALVKVRVEWRRALKRAKFAEEELKKIKSGTAKVEEAVAVAGPQKVTTKLETSSGDAECKTVPELKRKTSYENVDFPPKKARS